MIARGIELLHVWALHTHSAGELANKANNYAPEFDEETLMQIRSRFALALIALIPVTLSVHVRAAGSSFGNVKVMRSVTAKSSLSCAEWTQDRQVDSPSGSAESIWLLGFLSGVAWSDGKNILKDIDKSFIDVWMDKYCRENPLGTVANGGVILYEELKVKKTP
jgi:hypothetical protein